MSSNVYEMLWNCEYCGSEKLLGKTHRFCPNCGAAQDPARRYFPSDEEKVAVHEHHFVGADIECGACGTLNSGDAKFCQRCGAPINESMQITASSTRQRHESEAFEREDLQARIRQKLDAEAAGLPIPSESDQPKSNVRTIVAIMVVFAVVAGAIFAFTRTREETAVVSGHRWEREIDIERLTALNERRECNLIPADAYSVSRRIEQVDTQRVPDGEECTVQQVDQGDGTMREERQCQTKYRNEPVMGEVCYYTVDRWQSNRSVLADGEKGDELEWPATNISNDSFCTRLGCEREKDRHERFILEFGGEDPFDCTVDKSVWDETRIEAIFTIEVGIIGGGVRCGSLKSRE